jgi:hypothetical protein
MPWWAATVACCAAEETVCAGATVPCSTTPAAHPRIITLHFAVLGSCVNVMQASVYVRTGSGDGAASHYHSAGQGAGGSAQGGHKHRVHTRSRRHLSSKECKSLNKGCAPQLLHIVWTQGMSPEQLAAVSQQRFTPGQAVSPADLARTADMLQVSILPAVTIYKDVQTTLPVAPTRACSLLHDKRKSRPV